MILFLIVGFIFFAIGVVVLVSSIRFKNRAIRTIGRVVGFESYVSKSRDSSSSTMYNAVVEYEHDKSYRFRSKVGSSAMSYEIDQEVEVMLDPDDPIKAQIDRPAYKLFGPFIMAFGGVFMAIAIINMDWSFNFTKMDLIFYSPILLVALFAIFKKKSPEPVAAKKQMKQAFLKRKTGVVTKNESELEDSSDLFDKSPSHDGVLGYQPSEDMIRTVSEVAQIKEKQKLPQWAKGIGLLIGVAALVGGGYWTKARYDFIGSAETANGTVIKFETHQSDGTTMYAPVVEFKDANGQSHNFKSKTSTSHRSYNKGEAVTVYYTAKTPTNAMIDKGWMNWLFPSIIFLIGLVISIMSFKSLLSANKPREI